MEYFAICVVAVLSALAVYGAALVTYHVVPADEFTANQKIAIIALAWLLPILGPAICIAVLHGELPRKRRPGMPFLEYIFLAAVFSSDTNVESGTSAVEGHAHGSTGADDT